MKTTLLALPIVTLLFLAAGCDNASQPGTGSGASQTTSEKTSVSQVDPQILSDVVDGVFVIPGKSMLRTMRIQEFERGMRNIACGDGPLPLNNTASRFDQAQFPDLDLIAAKGLVEPSDPSEHVLVDGQTGCEQHNRLTSFAQWLDLETPWNDLARAEEQSESVVATKPAMASCLERESGLDVAADDPPTSFLVDSNDVLLKAKGRADQAVQSIRLGKIYAQCSAPYFAALAQLLLAHRPQYVERNRELLERFAGEVAAAGYVP